MALTLLATPALSEARSWSWWRSTSQNSNTAPVISGTPSTTTTVGSTYSFQPSAADANGDTLTFGISNKPSWASFNSRTGRLSGTPARAGTYTAIMINVSDGKARTSLSAFNITVNASTSTAANTAPAISGAPATSVIAGSAYRFKPTATDANSDTLGFSVSNKPGWASFSTATGELTGTPTSANVGSYPSINISVSDGKATASLTPFSISVTAPASSAPITGNATLTWIPPTTNTDGSTLTNLAGYKIYYGTSASNMGSSVSVSNGLTAYVINNLNSGTWYFAISSINTSGVESALSTVVSKTI